MSNIEYITGDVFLFEPDKSCVSRLICELSHSPVSHAAMYFEDGKIIEEGMPKIGTRKISELGDRAIHVRRYSKANKAHSDALLKEAKKRLSENEPYSMGNLVMIGVLSILNMWKQDARKDVKLAISALCVLLANVIDKKMAGGHATTCSQFVYEVYRESGPKLTINRKYDNQSANASSTSVSLLSLALDASKSGRSVIRPCDECDTKLAAENFDLEKLSCLLLDVLGKKEGNSENTKNSEMLASEKDGKVDNALDDELYGEIIKFASLLYRADNPKSFDRLALFNKNGATTDWIKRVLEHMLKNYSGFVMPGNLYYDCPELKNEIIVLNRDNKACEKCQ